MVKLDSPRSSLREAHAPWQSSLFLDHDAPLRGLVMTSRGKYYIYQITLKLCFIIFCSLYSSKIYAEVSRQEITEMKKLKEALSVEQQRLLKEENTIEKMIRELSRISEEKEEKMVELQGEIVKMLPLLTRLGRSNPLRMLVDPTTGQSKVRGIILMRFLITSMKRKMQQVQVALNDIKVRTNDLEIKNESTQQILREIENQKTQLSLLESKKIETWAKAELDRLAKEQDVTTLLDESRATLSKTVNAASKATALKGLPFRRLEQPVAGKAFKDASLQNKFSPHSEGIFFETQKNAQVCTPAKGKVVFKGPFRTQAEILIIDHGEQVHTILMGIHKIDAYIGKNVYAGERLGIMAGYGSENPRLYLELRHKGKSIDPIPYFAIKILE